MQTHLFLIVSASDVMWQGHAYGGAILGESSNSMEETNEHVQMNHSNHQKYY